MNEAASSVSTDILVARHIALEIMVAILDRRQPLDQALEDHAGLRAMAVRDRAFTRMLVATTLRRMGQIDDFIRRATEKEAPPTPPLLHHLLRIGAAQIAFMEVPDYAAADTSVRIADDCGLSRQKGLVNAVLRRIAREHQDWAQMQDAARMNMPDWLIKVWIDDYGLRTAGEIALAHMAEAPLDFSVKDPDMHEHWAQKLQAAILPTGTLRRVSGGAIQELPGFDDGVWWVQDAAASIPAQIFGEVSGKTVIDLCAAPGGKTAQLAVAGAHVVSLDRSANRLKRLAENLRRLNLAQNVHVEAADAAVWQPKEKAEYVLLDAPCTATGTIRRHPDVPHLKSADDMARLMVTQERLLANAARMLVPGGILVYCTCSLQKDEGERQVEKFLEQNKAFQRLPLSPADMGDMAAIINEQGDIRILPFHLAAQGGMDGFFISRLQRRI